MREKINKLSKGIIDGLSPIITYEPADFDFEAANGEKVRLEVNIASKDGLHMKGLIYASDPRFNVLTPAFGGQSLTLSVEVLCKFRDNTSSIEEQLCLVTNGGEFFIPVTIRQTGASTESGLSELKTIDDFAAVARADRDAAVRIFEYKGFINSPCMISLEHKALYHAFIGRNDRYLAVQEFLIACGCENVNLCREDRQEDVSVHESENRGTDISADQIDESFLRERRRLCKRYYFNYLNSRLLYEIGDGLDKSLPGVMIENLDRVLSYHVNEELIVLLKAEAMLLAGSVQKATALIDSVKNTIRNNRQELLREYCLLEYLEVLIFKLPDKKASFIRLLRKFLEEEHMTELFPLLVKLDTSLLSDDRRYIDLMRQTYEDGSRSPYLYLVYCRFLNAHPDYLHDPSAFDIQALNFGVRMHLLNEDIRMLIGSRVNNVHCCPELYYSILRSLFEESEDTELIKAICVMLIRSDRRDNYAHDMYSLGIDQGAEITGIYTYYMASVPNDPSYKISDRVIEYFAQGDNLSSGCKAALYCDVLRRKSSDPEVFGKYAQRIKDYALAQAKDGRVDERLAYIYSRTILPDDITSSTAAPLSGILNTYKITTESERIVSCIVLYPTLLDVQAYSFVKGQAYVPVLSRKAIILLQDTYGNRYVSIPYKAEKLLEDKELESACNELDPGSYTAKLSRMDQALGKSELSSEDASFLEYAVSSMSLFPESKAFIYSKLISYYNKASSAVTRPEFLLRIDKKTLRPGERQELINAFISCGCYSEAYNMCREYGTANVSGDNLMKMVSGLVLENMFKEESVLLDLAITSFNNSQYESVILDYLCEHYNGPTETMFRVLEAGIKEQVETYDLEERLIAQMIFVDHREHLDKVFEYYTKRKKISESIVRAYFTIKTASYFFSSDEIDSDVFDYLEAAIKDSADAAKIPLIYRLALSKHYSHMEELTQIQTEFCQQFVNSLLNEHILFPYFKRLSRFVKIPARVMNSAILVYPTDKGKFPFLKSKITPVDSVYRQDPMRKMYMNIHIRRNVLFADEVWKYEIYENDGDVAALKKKGELKYDHTSAFHSNDRFDKINGLIELLDDGVESELYSGLHDYVFESHLAEKLFNK